MKSKYNISDYIGKQFFYLTVLGESDCRKEDGSIAWSFICSCGKTIIESPQRVLSGHKKSCGCMRYKTPKQLTKKPSIRPAARIAIEDYIGKKNQRLTVVGAVRPETKGRIKLKCICDCGNIALVYPYQFDKGSIQSCGCARFGHSEIHAGNSYRKTHGLSSNRFYKKWNDMVRRCYNPNEPAYRFYGAKGISVCSDWKDSPEAFIKWCEETNPGDPALSLDRIDGLKGYSPENCRWSTQIQQVHNLTNNRFVTVNGETHCITEWCRMYHLSAGTIYKRVKKGQSFEKVISELISNKTAPVD